MNQIIMNQSHQLLHLISRISFNIVFVSLGVGFYKMQNVHDEKYLKLSLKIASVCSIIIGITGMLKLVTGDLRK